MMKCTNLNNRNIYVIPVGDFWEVEPERICMLYAPLSGQSSLVEWKMIEELEACASGANSKESLNQLIRQFSKPANLPFFKMNEHPEHLFQIDILLNYTCNFKCIYCYSAKGRSNQVVDWKNVQVLLDYLFCSERKQSRPYMINFSGGGEPLLSFDLIKKTIEYIETVAGEYKYTLGMVTNGSLLTSEIAEYLKKHKVEIVISFEILKDLQDKERGQYEKVASNIDMLLQRNIPFGIRTTFTHESVKRMREMITELQRRFPSIKQVVFDVVLSPDLFNTPNELRSYYQDYTSEYYVTKAYASSLGIKVESIAIETLSMLRDRTCEGKMVLTPVGSISVCSRISSPLEKDYMDYIYGEIKEGTLHIDSEKFKSIMTENNIFTQEICKDCFAKWNCGGGCRLFHKSFSEDFLPAKCDFTKEGLRIELFHSLCEKFEKKQNEDLYAYIAKKIKDNQI